MDRLEKRYRSWVAGFHAALAVYLLYLFYVPNQPSGNLWTSWLAHYHASFVFVAFLFLGGSLFAVFRCPDVLVWAIFLFDSVACVLAVAAVDPVLLPVFLAPGLMAGFFRFPYVLALSTELTVQTMAFLALLLGDLYPNPTLPKAAPLLTFGLSLALLNAGAFLFSSIINRALRENRRAEGLLGLIRVSHEMGSIHNYDKISELLTTVIRTMFDAHSFGLYVIEEEQGQSEKKRTVVPRWVESSHPQIFLPFDPDLKDSIMAEVLRSRKPEIVYDLRQRHDRLLVHLPNFRAGLFHPVLFEDELLGLIFLISDSPGAYGKEQVASVNLLSAQMAVTLKNVVLYEKTATMAITDSLTNLFTHGYFQERLMKLVVEHKYSEKPLGLIIFDVDFFKLINDRYGHPQGDYILRQLAGLMKSLSRSEDIVSRYGGDEFVLILPGFDRISASAFAERVRQAVEECSFVSGRNIVNITISAGVSSLPERLTAKDLVDAADEALYEAKKKGRNRIYYV